MIATLFQHRRLLAIGASLGVGLLLLVGGGWMLRASRVSSLAVSKTTGINLCEVMSAVPSPPPPSPAAPALSAPAELMPHKLIRNARLSLEIQRYEAFETGLRALTQRYGYLSNIQVNQDEHGVRRAEITLRVDAGRFDEALGAFKQLGSVKHEEISVEDVTRAYADLEARFANKRVSAARLREIIQTRTGKLSDVIEAEEALSRITEEMESMEAQKRSLDSQISYSTIRAEVHEPPAAVRVPLNLWAPVGEAVKEARRVLIGTLAFGIGAFLVLLPWALLGLGAFSLWRRCFRRGGGVDESSVS